MSEELKIRIHKDEIRTKLNARISKTEPLLDEIIFGENGLRQLKIMVRRWNNYNQRYLTQVFYDENDTNLIHYKKETTMSSEGENEEFSISDRILYQKKMLRDKIEILNDFLEELDLYTFIPDLPSESKEPRKNTNTKLSDSTKIFIVHGHDESLIHEVARVLTKLKLNPIILREQASGQKTIIEKIEEYSNVKYGVVLYTECDEGRKKGEKELKSRARQNVVFEHGFLNGKLGRENVCPIVKGSVELPGDIAGVVYVSEDGQWHLSLIKELRRAGLKVDANDL